MTHILEGTNNTSINVAIFILCRPTSDWLRKNQDNQQREKGHEMLSEHLLPDEDEQQNSRSIWATSSVNPAIESAGPKNAWLGFKGNRQAGKNGINSIIGPQTAAEEEEGRTCRQG